MRALRFRNRILWDTKQSSGTALGKPMMIGIPTPVIIILVPCKWVPVTMAWRVLRLRLEEQPPVWVVAVNILNMQSQRADKGWSSSLGFWREAKNSSQ
jgi:hypothetical protein